MSNTIFESHVRLHRQRAAHHSAAAAGPHGNPAPPGYTENEKMEIAKRFLVKRQREATGITDKNLSFTDEGLLHIIRHYTQESGVRNLEREIQIFPARWRAKSSPKENPSKAEIVPPTSTTTSAS